jgi:predicted amidohydrolase YtcJ
VPLAFGSDFPVEQPAPTLGLYAALTRQDLKGQPAGGWLPDHKLTLWEAVAGFTSGAAFAGRQERAAGGSRRAWRPT